MKMMNTSICSPISDDFPVNEADHDARAEHSGFEHVGVLLAHMRLEWLLQHFPPRLVWAVYVCVNGFITIGLLALAGASYGKPVCLSIARPNCVSLLLFPTGGSLQPAQYHPGARNWTHLWLCCLCAYGSLQPAFRRASRRSWRQGFGRCALALGYRCAHGSVPGKPSACRSDDSHRFARHHLSAQRTCHHRGRSDSAYGAGSRNQSARRNTLSSLEQAEASGNRAVNVVLICSPTLLLMRIAFQNAWMLSGQLLIEGKTAGSGRYGGCTIAVTVGGWDRDTQYKEWILKCRNYVVVRYEIAG